jgi:hypothetical protein
MGFRGNRARGGTKKVIWRCISRLEHGTSYRKHSPTLPEDALHDAILAAMNHLE